MVRRYDRTELIDEVRPLRSRADHAHLAAQYVKELRQFVNPSAADKSTNAGEAIVLRRRQTGRPSASASCLVLQFQSVKRPPTDTFCR
jgi:hypothetical protein